VAPVSSTCIDNHAFGDNLHDFAEFDCSPVTAADTSHGMFDQIGYEVNGILNDLPSMADLCLNLFDENVANAYAVRRDSFRFSGFDMDGLQGSLSWFTGLQRSCSVDSIFEGFQPRFAYGELSCRLEAHYRAPICQLWKIDAIV
jgi:hypothetical protein